MIAALKAWFDSRSLRERRMLLAMAAMIVLTVIWFGIFLPVSDGLFSSRTRLNDAVARLGEAQAERDSIADLARNRPQPIPGALADYLRQSAGDAGFALSNVEPQSDDRVRIAIPTARPGALFAWLADLEKAGVIVSTIDVSNNGDQTVSAQILLIERGA